MIQMFHVYKTYPNEIMALEDITLRVERGEFVFLTGPSGAGKTTLLKLLLCAERPSKGQILVNNQNITRMSRRHIPYYRRNIGFVFQDFKLLEHMTVYENIAFALRVIGVSPSELRKRVDHVLRIVHLEEKARTIPNRLSGGEKQRVAIARALVNRPLVLLADEPTGNLDPEITLDIMNLFGNIHLKGTTVVVATHDRHLVESFNRRIIALDKGRLVG